MDSQRALRVTLSGDLSGAYVVVEQRSDGSLVVMPDPSARPAAAPRRPASPITSLLGGLIAPAPKAMTGAEVLEGWGVELAAEERIEEFFVADVDDEAGFLAITNERFIFVADRGKGSTIVQEHLLSAARSVELIRSGWRHRIRVTWDGGESLVGGLDRKATARLAHHLQAR